MKDKTVALGMSGGIDSTMSALLLQEQGYRVIGLTMAIWDETIPIKESTKSGCFGPGEAEDIEAAKAAAQKLGIEHHVIHLKDEFKENVLSYFCNTYLDGRTPNPCVFCNQRMKFGLLPKVAAESGIEFDYFATGHYVGKTRDEQSGRWQLRKAIDPTKDQSYFLVFLSQEQLANTLFPLGMTRKEELRELAMRQGWEYLVKKKESQDFLETDDYSVLFPGDTFSSGDIIDQTGKKVGTHEGLIHYTIGQRRNLGLSGMSEPYYVIEIDAKNNRIIVGPQNALFHNELVAGSVNWISVAGITEPSRLSAKIRLGHDAAACTVYPEGTDRVRIVFDEPQLSITPGQITAIYDGDILLGGGIIL